MGVEHRSRGTGAAQRMALSMAVSATLIFTGAVAAGAATTDPNPGALELANGALSKTAATQGMVLLENHDSVLPIAKTGNLAVFGFGSYKTVKGGTGSGAVNNRYLVGVRDGLTQAGYSITTSPEYYDAMVATSVEQALTPATAQPTAPTDTALFVLARNSGEGRDRSSGQGDYLLSDIEFNDIQLLGKTYNKVVVVLNVGGIVDTGFFDKINSSTVDPSGGQALDSMLLMSQAGQESGSALTEVLNGTVTPSGKLTDSWASQYSYYPASATFASNNLDSLQEQYSEGIYVGYRYFDSLYKKLNPADPASVVNYPFGYGLSYTDLRVDPLDVTADMKSVVVKAKVTNTGKVNTGKDVVQVYFSAPQAGLDKPYQELAGYAKTDDLAPGASQTVTIRYNTTDMSSYDPSKAAYTMEAGDYLIRVGDSSRNTRVASRVRLDRTTITQQLANEETDRTVDTPLVSDPADFYAYPAQAAEISAAPLARLDTHHFRAAQDASPYEQSVTVDTTSPYYAIDKDKISSTTAYLAKGVTNWDGTGAAYPAKVGESVQYVDTDPSKTLFDVAKGRYPLKQFVAGLSVTQLANVVQGASAAGSTLTATGAAGYTTAKYESLGLPGMILSDGPAGLRITQQINSTPTTYQYGTAWPIGTMLAQTWDRPLVQKVGTAIGKEMAEYGVTLWLAPGMNIHRDPLNGRNFEYYSEDPLIAGLTAAATTQGVQSIPGVGVTLKHFFANNQETSRNTSNSVISERSIREIYLKGFEIAVKSAQPMAIMTSYNKVNDTYTSGTYDLNTDILRGEWGFNGLVMTDWGAGPRTGATGVYYSGNDLIEPGNNVNEVLNAIRKIVPTIDVSGLPSYNKLTTLSNNRTSWAWSFGGLTPSATGAESISTVVNATNVTAVPLSGSTVRDVINNEVYTPNAPYGSVQAAYADVTAMMTSSALNSTQKAGVSVSDVVYQTAGDATTPVVSYTVIVRGDYPATGYNLRLGDLQRSATRVINVAMQTAGFGQLATIKGVSGISVDSYTDQFRHLTSYLDASRGRIVQNSAPVVTKQPAASITVVEDGRVQLTSEATGTPRPSVQWQISTDGGQTWTNARCGTSSTYSFDASIRDDGNQYRATFTNSEGTTSSAVSTLTVRHHTHGSWR